MQAQRLALLKAATSLEIIYRGTWDNNLNGMKAKELLLKWQSHFFIEDTSL